MKLKKLPSLFPLLSHHNRCHPYHYFYLGAHIRKMVKGSIYKAHYGLAIDALFNHYIQHFDCFSSIISLKQHNNYWNNVQQWRLKY